MIEVDIHTKRVEASTRIFIGRPGGKYRFFEPFINSNFVGPDLPGLNLPKFESLDEVVDLEARVKRAVAIKRYALRGQREVPEPNNLLEYEGAPSDPATAQFLRVARAYYQNMRAGEIIIVPPANFGGLAHIGEFTAGPSHLRKLNVGLYPDDPLMGRNVRWLSTLPKKSLPNQALDALQKPSPLFLLERSAWPAIYRRAYGSYVTATEYGSRFEITADRYKINDDFRIQAFFNFVSSNTERVRAGSEDLLSLRDGAFAADGIAPDLFTNVNSPGGLSLKSALNTPIVIAVMLTLAVTVGAAAHAAAVAGVIVFGNTMAPPNDACTAEVSQQVVTQLTLLGYDRWVEACNIAQAAADATGISTTVNVTNQ